MLIRKLFYLPGDVRRKCNPTSDGNGVEWEEPDFSGCFSGGYVSLRKKVTTIIVITF